MRPSSSVGIVISIVSMRVVAGGADVIMTLVVSVIVVVRAFRYRCRCRKKVVSSVVIAVRTGMRTSTWILRWTWGCLDCDGGACWWCLW